MEAVQEAGIPCMIVINKLDRENVDFEKAIGSVESLFGGKTVAF
jgi:translation elongation factor EF-G